MNHIFILLDRSGSMLSMWNEALGGINGYIRGVKGTYAKVTLAVFDTVGYNVIRNTTTELWNDVTADEVQPRGGTPLLDSAGRMLWQMIDSKAERAIMVVVTDGEENSSSKFKASEIRALTQEATEKLDYEMVFLGANFDKINDVASKSFGHDFSTSYGASRSMPTSVRGFATAMNATASGTQSYFASGKAAEFYDNETMAKSKV